MCAGQTDGAATPACVYTTNGVNDNQVATNQRGFDMPSAAIWMPASPRLWVADTNNNRVITYIFGIMFSRNQTHVYGQPDFTSNAAPNPPNDASMNAPSGVAHENTMQFVWVADTGNNRILRFDASGGGPTSGWPAVDAIGQVDGFGNPIFTQNPVNNGQASVNEWGLNAPTSLFYDPTTERLYVADTGNNRVLVFEQAFDPFGSRTMLSNRDADYVLGQPDFASNGVVAPAQDSLNAPRGLTIFGNSLYVSDTGNNRILVFDVSAITNGELAVNVLGQPDFTSNTPATTRNGLRSPRGLGVISGCSTDYLMVADSLNHRVLTYDLSTMTDGGPATHVFGQASFTTAAAPSPPNQTSMNTPVDLVPDGNQFNVIDQGNHRIVLYPFDATTCSCM
jgi:sugar lactone lactonase YvrE